MKFFTPYSLLLALLVTGPGLWTAFNDPGVSAAPAVFHFVLAALVFGIGLTLVGGIVRAYSDGAGRRAEASAAEDAALAATRQATDGATAAEATDDRAMAGDNDGALSAA